MPRKPTFSPLRPFVLSVLAGTIWFLVSDYWIPGLAWAEFLRPAIDILFVLGVISWLCLLLRQIASLRADSAAREASLRLAEEKYENFTRHLPVGCLRCQIVRQFGHPVDYLCLEANAFLENLISSNSVAGRKASELPFFKPEPFQELLDTLERVAHTGLPEQREYLDPTTNRWFAWKISNLKPDNVMVIFVDISERKSLEQTAREEAACFKAIFDASPAGMVITRQLDGVILNANSTFARLHGHKPEELVGHVSTELNLWGDVSARETMLNVLKTEGRCVEMEIKSRRQNGEPFDAAVSVEQLKIKGQPCFLGVLRHISHSKLAEHVLEDERRLRLILGQTRCIINSGTVTAEPGWRERALREDWPFVWDYPVLNLDIAQQVMPLAISENTSYYEVWTASRNREDEIQMHRNSGRAFLVESPFYRNEFRCRDKHGVDHWMQQLVTIHKEAEGRWQLFGVTVDISELKHAYQALGESEQQFRSCIEFLPMPICIADKQGVVLYYNEMFTECFGYTRADTPTIDHWARQAYKDTAVREKHMRDWHREVNQAMREEVPTRPRVYQLTCKNGSPRQVEITTRPTGRYLISVFNDLTDRLQSEDQLRKLSRAVEQCPVSIFITDAQGRIEYVNPRFTELTGYQPGEALGKNPRFLKSSEAPPELFRQLWKTITAGHDWHGEMHNRKKNGELYWERTLISPIFDKDAQTITHFLALKEDISVQKQLEQQLRQSQKMEAMGLLASGVAHDFNNVLTVIQGNAEMMLQAKLTTQEFVEHAAQIATASERGANLTRQLLMFSRKQVLQPVNLDLNRVAAQMTKMLQRILGEDITLFSHYAANLPAIKGDAGMIEQIILNLAVNARDAMPNGGHLTITTTGDCLDNNSPAVCLTIADNGCGIPQDIISHIFEPFFTTKEIGKGTGLGLATVFSIVQQHQGKLEAVSETGRGTTFRIKFPRAPGPGVGEAKPGPLPLPRGSETILVVEDELPVRMFVGRLLERCGYKILAAESGIDALVTWEENKQKIDLLLTDIIMPGGLNGYELAGRLLAERPELKVVYTSGYTGDATGRRSGLVEGLNFLQKPYPPVRLAEILRRALNTK